MNAISNAPRRDAVQTPGGVANAPGGAKAELQTVHARLEKIRPSPVNGRRDFESVPALAENIKAVGLGNPILVKALPRYTLLEPDLTSKMWRVAPAGGNRKPPGETPAGATGTVALPVEFAKEKEARAAFEEVSRHEFEIIARERRWRAFQLLKRETIPVIVKEVDDKTAFGLQMAENLQRETLSAMEEARGYQTALDKFGYTVEELVKETKMSRSHVFSVLRLLKLDKASQAAIEKYKLPDSIATLIPTVAEKQRAQVIEEIATRGPYDPERGKSTCMSARQAKDWIASRYRQDLKHAKFDVKDETLLQGATSCETCPKRSGNMALEGNPNVCTDPKCYERKGSAALNAKLDVYREKGMEVISAQQSQGLFWYGSDLKGGSGFVKRNDAPDGSKKTYQQLAGDTVKPVVALSKDNQPLLLYRVKDLKPVLKEKGIKPVQEEAGDGKRSAQQAKESRKRKELEARNEAIWAMALKQIRAKVVTGKTDKAFLRLLVELPGDNWQVQKLLKGWKLKKADLAKQDESVLRGLVLEMAMSDSVDGAVDYYGRLNVGAKKVMEHFKIDPKELGKEIEAAAEKKTERPKVEVKLAAKNAKTRKKGKGKKK